MSYLLKKIVRRKKRIGRGVGSKGAKSGRGMKGQRSRAGWRQRAGHEGGQTPLYMRLPKGKGVKQKFPSQVKKPVAISLGSLNRFEEGEIVGPGQLRKAGFLKRRSQTWKLIGKEGLEKKLTIRAHAASTGAKAAVEKVGGKIELIGRE